MPRKIPRLQNNIKILNDIKNRAPDRFDRQIGELIDLYSNRRIKNIITVKNTIKALTSNQVTKTFKSKYDFSAILDRYETAEDKERKNSERAEVERKRKEIHYEVHDGDLNKANTYVRFKITNTPTDEDGKQMYGFEQIVNKFRRPLTNKVKEVLRIKKSMKIRMRINFTVNKHGELKDVVFNSDKEPRVITKANLKKAVMSEIELLISKLEYSSERDSGWFIVKYNHIDVDFFETKPLRAASYIPTPEKYNHSRCGLINIKNEDLECFRWCMLYHQTKKEKNDDRLSRLKKVEDKYTYTNMSYPTSYSGISKFEVENKVCIFVYALDEEKGIICDKQGNCEYILNDRIYLLRIEDKERDQSHYVYIKHLDRLFHIHNHSCDVGKRFCPICEKKIPHEEYTKHLSLCYRFARDSTLLTLPKEGETMEFKNYKNMLQRPFIVYADCECSLCPTGEEERIALHKPNSACFYFVCTYDSSQNYLWHRVGDNCITEMIVELDKLSKKCIKKMKENTEMKLSWSDWDNFKHSACCHICNKPFGEKEKKVRDHDHRTGKYRGAAHEKCNINYYNNRYLPVVFHNLRGYDSHLIIKSAYDIAEKLSSDRFSVIPNSSEKFMSFSVNDCKFIDSMQFMLSSLESLVENLYETGEDDKFKNFTFIKNYFADDLDLMCRKGFYPYEWVDNIEKLDHVGLPPKSAFYSKLKQEDISDKDYKHAETVYDKLKCQTFKDYHLAYLKCDVLLLADVFENFRKTCMSYYKLDPANYLTAASLAWDAMLLKTGVELELITDLDTLNMIEKSKRGGLCFVGSNRYVKANNKYLPDFDINKPSNYIMYWDANNLYGWAMSQALPYKDLKFNNDVKLEDILNTPDDSEVGYIVECDFNFPEHLHDKFREFPPCPETLTPNMEWFSQFQKEVGEKSGIIKNEKYRGTNKLVPHLMEHKNYVLHYRNLKFIKELGVEVTHMHKVLSFKQKPWLKDYIDFNTAKRKEAKNEFEKDFFKLMNNSVFGKTMEDVKNRMNMHMTTSKENAIKWFSKLNFKDSREFDGLHLIEMYRKEIKYDKPIYVGTSILDLSKLCMMDFHYNTIHKNFENRYSLLYSDTDSLVYSIEHDDIYDWTKQHDASFDLSESTREDLRDSKNKKVLGKMKDEMNSSLMKEFIALNPKVYSVTHEKLNEETQKLEIENKKTLKGVSKVVVKKEITHEAYVEVLEKDEKLKCYVTSIRSFNHQIYTVKSEKIALNNFYDKMMMIDSIHCIPYGYKPSSL